LLIRLRVLHHLRLLLAIAALHGRAVGILRCLLGSILDRLGLLSRHDTKIMLGMLKVILGCDAITGTVGVTRQLQILLVNMSGRAADLHFRPRRIECAVGIKPTATTAAATTAAAAAIIIVVRPAAASTRALHVSPIIIVSQSCLFFLGQRTIAMALSGAVLNFVLESPARCLLAAPAARGSRENGRNLLIPLSTT